MFAEYIKLLIQTSYTYRVIEMDLRDAIDWDALYSQTGIEYHYSRTSFKFTNTMAAMGFTTFSEFMFPRRLTSEPMIVSPHGWMSDASLRVVISNADKAHTKPKWDKDAVSPVFRYNRAAAKAPILPNVATVASYTTNGVIGKYANAIEQLRSMGKPLADFKGFQSDSWASEMLRKAGHTCTLRGDLDESLNENLKNYIGKMSAATGRAEMRYRLERYLERFRDSVMPSRLAVDALRGGIRRGELTYLSAFTAKSRSLFPEWSGRAVISPAPSNDDVGRTLVPYTTARALLAHPRRFGLTHACNPLSDAERFNRAEVMCAREEMQRKREDIMAAIVERVRKKDLL